MSNAPVFNIDVAEFVANPYPLLKRMRAEAPIATPTCTGWAFRELTSLDCEWDS